MKEGNAIISNVDYPALIGRSIKDENGKEIGKIQSFLIDSSGRTTEILIQNKNEEFVQYPVEKLRIDQNEIFLNNAGRVESFSERFPILKKKKEILDNLCKKNEILPEVYEGLAAEFDKSLDEMKHEGENLASDLEKQIQNEENSVKMLHLARTFLEMEHGIGKVEEQIYQQSLVSILKETKIVSYRKMKLTKDKDKILSILSGEKTELFNDASSNDAVSSPVDQNTVITVRMTQE